MSFSDQQICTLISDLTTIISDEWLCPGVVTRKKTVLFGLRSILTWVIEACIYSILFEYFFSFAYFSKEMPIGFLSSLNLFFFIVLDEVLIKLNTNILLDFYCKKMNIHIFTIHTCLCIVLLAHKTVAYLIVKKVATLVVCQLHCI